MGTQAARKWGVDDFYVEIREKHGEERAIRAVRELIEKAVPMEVIEAELPQPDNDNGATVADDGRTLIMLSTDDHAMADRAVAALAGDPELYSRGRALVRLGRDRAGMPVIDGLTCAALIDRISRVARFAVESKSKKGGSLSPKPVPVPRRTAEIVASRGQWAGIRELVGTIEAPSLRSDGTLIDTQGYDSQSGLYFASAREWPRIDVKPSHDDAKRAAKTLLNLVAQFPFVDDRHHAAWLAAACTPFARPAIDGCVPLMALDAAAPGTGKTLLVDVISALATGRTAPRYAYTNDADESRKLMLSIALAGTNLLLFDNLTCEIGDAALDAVLTAPTVSGRRLGRSETVPELPVRTVFFATGNNLVYRTIDFERRALRMRLESPLARPETRSDLQIPNLEQHVRERRTDLVTAALTVLLAHREAGLPRCGVANWGSFEQWVRTVGAAVAWATGVDPTATRRDAVESRSSEVVARAHLLDSLWRLGAIPSRGRTAREILALATSDAQLHDSLEVLLPGGREPTPAVLAHVLRRQLGTATDAPRGVLRLRSAANRDGVQLWWAESVAVSPAPALGPGGQESHGGAGVAGVALSEKSQTPAKKHEQKQWGAGVAGVAGAVSSQAREEKDLSVIYGTHARSGERGEVPPQPPQSPQASLTPGRGRLRV